MNGSPGSRQPPYYPGGSPESEVLGYLLRNPEARDTAMGIREWWLTQRQWPAAQVEATLERLVKDGLLMADHCQDGHTYYSLDPAKQSELRSFFIQG